MATDGFSEFITGGRVDELVEPAQKEMLDEFMKKYNLEDQDWRPKMYEDLKKK